MKGCARTEAQSKGTFTCFSSARTYLNMRPITMWVMYVLHADAYACTHQHSWHAMFVPAYFGQLPSPKILTWLIKNAGMLQFNVEIIWCNLLEA